MDRIVPSMRDGSHVPGGVIKVVSNLDEPQRLLLTLAAANLVVAALCVIWIVVSEATPVLGLHPGAKPAKFGLSLAFFLGTYAVLLGRLQTTPRNRRRFANVVVVTMVIEILAIVVQALRGVPSHFNESTLLDYLVWSAMGVAIAVATVAIAWSAWIATRRPLLRGDGAPLSPGLTLAWRAGLWLLVFSAVSGAAMGGQKAHSVGGMDGGAGLAITNWSTTHGDLRVSHFFSMHAFQALPIVAFVLPDLPRPWLIAVIVGYSAVCVGTFIQAIMGVPLFG